LTNTILVTGGTGKLGRRFVTHFANKGWVVLFTSTSRLRARDLLDELGRPERVIGFISDFSEHGAPEKLIEEVKSGGHTVNHLVNNARSQESLQLNSMGQTDRSHFMDEYLLDVVVPYELSILLFNLQPDQLRTITNIGSQYGVVAFNPYLNGSDPSQQPAIQYGVAKAALHHLTKELAVRMAGRNVRVNCVAFGGVDGRVDRAFKERYADLTPSRRMLSEEEVEGPVAFLTSEASSAITGHTIIADGGWTIW
jgi:hypothetical protein